MDEVNKIYNESCLDTLKKIPDECVDLVCTDPPYIICSGGCSSEIYMTPDGEIKKRKGSGMHKASANQLNENGIYQQTYKIDENGKRVKVGTRHINIGGVLNDAEKDVRTGKMFAHNDIKFSEWLPDVYRVLKQGTHCYVMINARNLCELQTEAEKVGFQFQQLLCWRKNNATPNRYYLNQLEFILMLRKGAAKDINNMSMSNCLSVPNILGNKVHPTEKPVSLMRVLIEQSSNKGDLVLDPFMGGGSTALAAKQSGRNFIGSEIDPKYYDICLKRLNQETQGELFDFL